MAYSTSLNDVVIISSFTVELEESPAKVGRIYGQGQNEAAIRVKLKLQDADQNPVIPSQEDLYKNI